MRRKGITPVIAVVLLISITVSAAGSVYYYVNAAQPNVGDNVEDELGENFQINFESCWDDGSGYSYSIRNTGEEAFNSSKIDVLVNSQPGNTYNFDQTVVNPQNTVQLFVDGVNNGDTIELIMGEQKYQETCRGL